MPYRVLCALNLTVRVRMGERLINVPVNRTQGASHLCRRLSWMTQVVDRLVNIKPGVFVDVGANIGQTLLELQLTHPGIKYVGIEPSLNCIAYLKDFIAANGFADCALVPIALASRSGLVGMHHSPGVLTDVSATIMADLRPGRDYEVSYVPCFPFDAIFDSLRAPPPAFIKIDVEGAELEVLFGMRSSVSAHRPIILCEVLFSDSRVPLSVTAARNARMMEYLSQVNYTVSQLIKSADGGHVLRTEEISEFPSAFWSEENKDLCDYLFLPAEDDDATLDSLFSISAGETGSGLR